MSKDWEINKRNASSRYGHNKPPSVVAKKSFYGQVGAGNAYSDIAQVLICVYADGSRTVSMNGIAHIDADELRKMAEVMQECERSL